MRTASQINRLANFVANITLLRIEADRLSSSFLLVRSPRCATINQQVDDASVRARRDAFARDNLPRVR